MSRKRQITNKIILEARNLTKFYGERAIFDSQSFNIYKGECVGIVGENGSGKTTLMKILAGVENPDLGVVIRHASVSYIPQMPEHDNIDIFNLDWRMINPVGDKSGGERMRLVISSELSKGTAFVMADEPTSNLDTDSIFMLEEELEEVETLIVISHDRTLLDKFCNRILEIKDGKINEFSGNYSAYLEETKRREQFFESEYESYISEKRRLEKTLKEQQNKASKMTKTPSRMGNSEARLHKMEVRQKKGKADGENAVLKKRIEGLEEKERPKKTVNVHIDLSMTNPPANKYVLRAENFSFAYEDNVVFDNVSFNIGNSAKVAVLGSNGCGKSTLLNAVYNREKGIYMPPQVKCGILSQQFLNMDFEKSVLDNVLQNSMQSQAVCRNILARLLICGNDVHREFKTLSGGEKIKAGLASLIVSDVNFLILDEPTNYLDSKSLEALTEVLKGYDGTVMFASHDRSFVDAVATDTINIDIFKTK